MTRTFNKASQSFNARTASLSLALPRPPDEAARASLHRLAAVGPLPALARLTGGSRPLLSFYVTPGTNPHDMRPPNNYVNGPYKASFGNIDKPARRWPILKR